eukprot:PhM_4_TR17053/c0_g1_i2/m.18447/K18624/MAEA, EMP; macrophage erythroblast attacher
MNFNRPLLTTPCDGLTRSVKQTTKLDKDFQVVLNALTALAKREADNPNVANTISSLDKIAAKVRSTKTKARENQQAVGANITRLELRLCHIRCGNSEEKRQRLYRLMCQHLLDVGLNTLGMKLAERAHVVELVDNVDSSEVNVIISSLVERHSTTEALAWASENSAKLQRAGSTLESDLHIQEAIRRRLASEASPAACATYIKQKCRSGSSVELSSVFTALAIFDPKVGPDRLPPRLRMFFRDSRWDALASAFRTAVSQLSGVSAVGTSETSTQLVALVRAGTLQLNCPQVLDDGTPTDPMRHPAVRALAYATPTCIRKDSKVLCPITHQVMDSDNHALAMPNGYVFSQKGVRALMRYPTVVGGTTVLCPQTKEVFSVESLKRVLFV